MAILSQGYLSKEYTQLDSLRYFFQLMKSGILFCIFLVSLPTLNGTHFTDKTSVMGNFSFPLATRRILWADGKFSQLEPSASCSWIFRTLPSSKLCTLDHCAASNWLFHQVSVNISKQITANITLAP